MLKEEGDTRSNHPDQLNPSCGVTDVAARLPSHPNLLVFYSESFLCLRNLCLSHFHGQLVSLLKCLLVSFKKGYCFLSWIYDPCIVISFCTLCEVATTFFPIWISTCLVPAVGKSGMAVTLLVWIRESPCWLIFGLCCSFSLFIFL